MENKFDYKKIIENLKKNFTAEEMREISAEILNSDIEYRKSEEYCENYIYDIDNSELQVRKETFESQKNTDRKKEIVEKLLDNFSTDIIDSMEFNYYDVGTPFYRVTEDIYFQIANLSEMEIPIPEDLQEIFKKSLLSEEIKEDLEFETNLTINNDYKYGYYDVSYDSIVYGISYNDFLKEISENYISEEEHQEKKILIQEFIGLVGEDKFNSEILEKFT